jgi:hypothetical protein
MSQHLSTDATLTVLGAGPLGGMLLLGTLIGLAVLLVWFPPPVLGLFRGLFTRLSPVRDSPVATRQNSAL